MHRFTLCKLFPCISAPDKSGICNRMFSYTYYSHYDSTTFDVMFHCVYYFPTLDFVVYNAIFSARQILMFHASQNYCAHIDCIIVCIDSFGNVCAALQLCISVHLEKLTICSEYNKL